MENPALPFAALHDIGRLTKDGIVIYNSGRQRIDYINEPASRLTGLQGHAGAAEIATILQRVNPDEREVLVAQLAEAVQKVTAEVEFTLIHEDNSVMVSCHSYQLHDTTVIIIRDITRMRQHEDYLVRYGAKKNVLLDNITHHISGALSLMQHLAVEAGKLLRADAEINVKTYINLMEANCLHCIDIINELMQHEYRESADIAVKKTKVDVVQIVSIIYQELLQSYSARKITMQSESASIQIMTDNVKLLLVINNLTSNALKFSHPEALIFIAIRETETEVIISVADQGIGIPDSLKPSIFQRQPGGGRTGLNGERTNGMGLAICKHLVTLLDGQIWFESEEGKGSTFYLSLPKY